jgi:hypothetical protein
MKAFKFISRKYKCMPQPDGIIYGDINGDTGRRVDKIFLKQ